MELDDKYLQLIQADEFVKNFKTMHEFRLFLYADGVTKQDLVEYLKVLERYELYEHCQEVKIAIDNF